MNKDNTYEPTFSGLRYSEKLLENVILCLKTSQKICFLSNGSRENGPFIVKTKLLILFSNSQVDHAKEIEFELLDIVIKETLHVS